MNALLQQLRERIERTGSISVAEYMELCNTHYYATRDPFGVQGDFTTAPEISQIFGELIGAWVAECWLQMGSPQAVLCEIGPGRGTLMKDILRATRNVPGFHASIRVRMIETSPVLQALQQKTLHEMHHDIEWKTSFEAMPSLPLLLVANEFFDALPVHQFMKDGSERTIGIKDGELCFMQRGDGVRETSPASYAIMRSIALHIKAHRGAALVIDYGYETAKSVDTLQALRAHKFTHPLEQSGESDLTAHVDFGVLRAACPHLSSYFTTQADFLRRLGAEIRATALCKNAAPEQYAAILSGLERLIAPEQMGELFKVLAVTSLIEKPAGF